MKFQKPVRGSKFYKELDNLLDLHGEAAYRADIRAFERVAATRALQQPMRHLVALDKMPQDKNRRASILRMARFGGVPAVASKTLTHEEKWACVDADAVWGPFLKARVAPGICVVEVDKPEEHNGQVPRVAALAWRLLSK